MANDIVFTPFDKQIDFMKSRKTSRFRGAFAGKRGGKTEVGAIESIVFTEQKLGYKKSSIDKYLGVMVAPTTDMMRRLTLQKFLAYAKPFRHSYHITKNEIDWHNGAKIHCISGDKPNRIEGLKANWIWIDEVFQCSEQLFLECMARVADTEGHIWVTGSLGTQYANPKRHWAYKYFKEKELESFSCFEWTTADNPYFPRSELSRLKDTLDPRTFRQMFTIDWSVPGTALVYDEFTDDNIISGFVPDPTKHEISVCIDWGWSHEMAALFFAYDPVNDQVFLFDEIVGSRINLFNLHRRIMAKEYRIKRWFCDIAGNQEREALGGSNVQWFRDKGIIFDYRQTAISYGLPIVRQYILNGRGQRKLFIDKRCEKSIDGILNYSYPEKDGIITDESPLKKNDDCMDALRYYFVNRLDPDHARPEFKEFNRWGKEWKF